MTTIKTTGFRLPDPPEREPEEMTSFDHMARAGGAYLLAEHLGNPDTTLVAGERYISPVPTRDMTGVKYPDLLVAFDVDPEAYHSSNAYIISEQGKPPGLRTGGGFAPHWGRGHGREARGVRGALGSQNYWRFDETGEHHGERLAGDRLVDGVYEPVDIEPVAEGILQGHSDVLDLDIRWHDGLLEWYDPETGCHIPTLVDPAKPRPRARGGAATTAGRVGAARGRNRRPVRSR